MLGDDCPPELEPSGTEADAVDLVLVAGADLGLALRTSAALLAPDGLLYVAAPPRRVVGVIQSVGLVAGPALVMLRGTGSRRLLVPVQAARYAFDRLVPAAGWRGRAARLAVSAGGARLLPHFTPGGVVARRPGARPLHDWLRAEGGVDASSAIVSWGDGPSLVVHADGTVVKVGGRMTEAETLRELAPAAREAGARVPEAIRTGSVAGLPLLVESALPGRPAGLGAPDAEQAPGVSR